MRHLILIVDDEREVLDSVRFDLAMFEGHFAIETAESADEADEILADCQSQNQQVALILCDHRMPGRTGVDFLVSLQGNPVCSATRKVLLTGQAGHEDTIRAINDAGLDHYVGKPWVKAGLVEVAKAQLTAFVLAADANPARFADVLDAERIFSHIHADGGYG